MATIEESPCPACMTLCSLTTAPGFHTFSFLVESPTGRRLVQGAFDAPRIICSACDLDLIGVYDDDEQHANFPRVSPRKPRTDRSMK